MWIWICVGVIVWVVCGVVMFRIEKNYYATKGWSWCWDSYDIMSTFLDIAFAPFAVIAALIWWNKKCFKKGNKMKIYWNEKEGQIMTKDGKCRSDMPAMIELVGGADDRVNTHFKYCEDRYAKLKAQLQCGAKGHGDWEYVRKQQCKGYIEVVFRCSSCGLEITKTKKELTKKQLDSECGHGN